MGRIGMMWTLRGFPQRSESLYGFFIPHFIGDREVGDHIMSGGSDFQRRAFISLFLK